MVNVVDYLKFLKANVELVQGMAQKDEQKQKESFLYYHDQRAVDQVFNVEEFVHGRPTNYTTSGRGLLLLP